MKTLISVPVFFDPVNKTLDFSLFSNFSANKLYGVINVTRNQILYAPGSTNYGGTFNNSILTLNFDTSTYNTADKINVYYEASPGEFENNTPVEYGGILQQMQETLERILYELQVHSIILAEGLNIRRTDIDDLRRQMKQLDND